MRQPEIKLICFDLNKTLIEENTWYSLNLAMGMTKEEDEFFAKLFKEGIISYVEWQNLLTRIYKKRGKATLQKISQAISSYSYKEDAKEIVEYLKGKGYRIALISGAMDILVEKVAKELDIGMYEANNIFIFDENDYLENIVTLDNDSLAKLRHLQSFCRELGIRLTECACVGDGENDAELFEKTGYGVTFTGSKIKDLAWKTIGKLADLKKIV